MMRIMLAAALGLAPLAPAFADGEALEFRISNELSPSQPRATIEVWASFDPADYALAGVAFAVRGGEPGWVDGTQVAFDGKSTGFEYPGVVTGPDVVDIIAGQLHFPPPIIADPSNPIWIWAADFETTDFTPRAIALTTETLRSNVYPSATSAASEPRSFAEGIGAIRVIPAPGVVILPFSLAAVGAARRRRS